MATPIPKINISELLCFAKYSFAKVNVAMLKAVITDFYSESDICLAKEMVHADVSALNVPIALPRLLKRKGENRAKQSVDALVELLQLVDENVLWDRLPMYVVPDLSRIPTINMDSMDVISVARRLDKLESKVDSMTDVVSKPSDKMANGPLITSADNMMGSAVSGSSTSPSPGMSYAAAVSGMVVNDNDQFATVTRRKTQKTKSSVVGNKSCVVGKLKSARPMASVVKKFIFHLDNVGDDVSVDAVTDYLNGSDVEVLSCFSAKSWMKSRPSDTVCNAFRVCVKLTEKDRVFDQGIWPAGVIIREWKFLKPKEPNHGGSE